jgi:hypothetical protein
MLHNHQKNIGWFIHTCRNNDDFCSRENLFYEILLPPLRANPAPVGGGSACDAPLLPVHKNAKEIFVQVIRHYRNRGATSSGAKPLERQVILNDFNRTMSFICSPSRVLQNDINVNENSWHYR